MPKFGLRGSDVVGATRLAIDAVSGLTDVVESMHGTIASVPLPIGTPPKEKSRGLTRFVYQNIRYATRLVGGGLDLVLPLLTSRFGAHNADGVGARTRSALVSVINGVVGDHLEATHNPLAIEMGFLPAPVESPKSRVLIVVHGLCLNAASWLRLGHHHGEALAKSLGYTLLALEYNTGRHISTNGRELAQKLQDLVDSWPVPVEEIVIVGHSMGGLVARSACHYGGIGDHSWLSRLRALVFLGTPHHGAPLERVGNMVERALEISAYSAPIARLGGLRSAGITDLRFGNILDEHWQNATPRIAKDVRTPVPLPANVRCFTVGGTLGLETDGLVPLASALGTHAETHLNLEFPDGHRYVVEGCDHLGLLYMPRVFEQLERWLARH